MGARCSAVIRRRRAPVIRVTQAVTRSESRAAARALTREPADSVGITPCQRRHSARSIEIPVLYALLAAFRNACCNISFENQIRVLLLDCVRKSLS